MAFRIAPIFLALLSFNAFAQASEFAQATDFEGCGQSAAGVAIRAKVISAGETDYDSSLSLDGQNLPILGERCFVSDRPSTRFVKCAHGNAEGSTRAEIYLTLHRLTDSITRLGVVLWTGDDAESVRLEACEVRSRSDVRGARRVR